MTCQCLRRCGTGCCGDAQPKFLCDAQVIDGGISWLLGEGMVFDEFENFADLFSNQVAFTSVPLVFMSNIPPPLHTAVRTSIEGYSDSNSNSIEIKKTAVSLGRTLDSKIHIKND